MNNLFIQAFFQSLKIAFKGNQKTYQNLYQQYSDRAAYSSDAQEVNTLNDQFLEELSDNMLLLRQYAPWRPKCYNLALTTVQFLTAKKIPYQLFIGFRHSNKDLEGHAWVKVGHKVICGERSDLHTYKKLIL